LGWETGQFAWSTSHFADAKSEMTDVKSEMTDTKSKMTRAKSKMTRVICILSSATVVVHVRDSPFFRQKTGTELMDGCQC
jgi:hypothetical protein